MGTTTSCDSIWDSLSAYADGLAPALERTRVEEHVAQCETCARDLAFMRHTATVLSHVPEVAPPVGLRESILAATVNKRAWYQRLGWSGSQTAFGFRQLAYAGAAAAAGVVLAFVVVGRERSNTSDLDLPGRVEVALNPPSAPKTKSDVHEPLHIKAPHPQNLALSPEIPAHHNEVDGTVPRFRMEAPRAVDTDYRPRLPLTAPKLSSPSQPKIALNPRPAATEPGRKKTTNSPSPTSENLGPNMETANMLTPMTMDPEMAPMIKDATAGPVNSNAATPSPAEAAHREYHIQLMTSDEPVNAGSVAGLADLRKLLKNNQAFKAPTIPLVRSNDRKEVKLDLVKGKF